MRNLSTMITNFDFVPNFIDGKETPALSGDLFDKLSPHDGKVVYRVAKSAEADVKAAVDGALSAQPAWAETPAVRRGEILRAVAAGLLSHRQEVAEIVARETGKSLANALGEVDGAASLGFFFAGEGQRLFGRTTTSGAAGKWAMTIRCPVGVAGLIIAANTPIANVAWKVFPALICGNAAVLKAAEDTPATASIFARIAVEAGLPSGVLNIIQGLGRETGPALVDDSRVGVISFTGSTAVGREIAVAAGKRLAKVSLELGGKNPLVVCDDADLDNAVKWICLSAYSNAGQRCAAASRILVFESVYDALVEKLVAATKAQKVGPADTDDFGPVINERQLNRMVAAVEKAKSQGATILAGGHRLDDSAHAAGFYMAPTLIADVDPASEISECELFGPIACLYRVKNYEEALRLANDSPYGLTACIHTSNFDRALDFSRRVHSGVAVVNAGTFGSEPHMPFGGVKASGNGSREPGTEAIDIYSDLKDVYLSVSVPA